MSDVFNEKRGDDSERILPTLEADGVTFNPANPQNVRAAELAMEKLHDLMASLMASAVRAAEESGANNVPTQEHINEVVRGIAMYAMISQVYKIPRIAAGLFSHISDGVEEMLKSRDQHEAGGHCDECDPLKRSQFEDDDSIGAVVGTADMEAEVMASCIQALKHAVPPFIEGFIDERREDKVGNEGREVMLLMVTFDGSEALSIDVGPKHKAMEIPVNVRAFDTIRSPERIRDAVSVLLDETSYDNPKNAGRIKHVKSPRVTSASSDPRSLSGLAQQQIDAAAEQARSILDKLRNGGKKGGAS